MQKITTIEHLRDLATIVKGFTANLFGTAAEAIEEVAGTAAEAKETAVTAGKNVESLQKDVGILTDNEKHMLAAMNLFVTSMQAEMQELKTETDETKKTAVTTGKNVESLQKDVGILADDYKHVLTAMNLFMTTTQAEVRELKKLVSTLQAQISALSS